MSTYKVVWEFEVEAETPTEAARQAFESGVLSAQSGEQPILTVTNEQGESVDIDLEELSE